jgi:DNA-binding NtrC family response regulator
MIAAGRFREDLYFRLHVITIRVPPLRERVEDIPELARVFLGQICQDNGLRTKTLTAKAIHALRRHSWPGNVRELKNVLESTAIIHPGELVRLTALPATVRETGARVRRRTPKPAGVSLRDVERDVLRRALTQHHGNRTHAARSLRIGVRTLQRKIKTYGIDVPYAAGRRSTQRSTETPRPSASSHGRM